MRIGTGTIKQIRGGLFMDNLKRLVAYTEWGNRTWLDFIHAHAPDDAYLTLMISHVYLAERVWFQRIYGEETRNDVFTTASHAELEALAPVLKQRYQELLAGDLARVVEYKRFDGEAMASEIADILNHLVTHGSHHRGQMARYASQQLGIKPPETSYIMFSRMLQAS
jgi:uncharacterized damage-inducible protein DinB